MGLVAPCSDHACGSCGLWPNFKPQNSAALEKKILNVAEGQHARMIIFGPSIASSPVDRPILLPSTAKSPASWPESMDVYTTFPRLSNDNIR